MRDVKLSVSLVGAALAVLLQIAPAQAQATRTWVSGNGDDANTCSNTAPCKTFAGAISKTAAGGAINVLDPGGFGAVTITKSITISSEGFEAGVLASGTNGININAGTSDIVVLRGLDIDGAPSGSGLIGVNFINGGTLHIEKSTIRNFRSGTAAGILFTPPAGSGGQLVVSDTIIEGNGSAATNGGLVIRPGAGGAAKVLLDGVRVTGNSAGIITDSTSGVVRITLRDSVSSLNVGNGLAASGANSTIVAIERSTFNSNSGTGVSATGGSVVMLGASTVSANLVGVAVASGGQIQSYRNNSISQNLNDNLGALTTASQN